MIRNVKFLKGTNADYNLVTKDPNTFYYTFDDNQLYLGTIKLSNASDLQIAIGRIVQNEQDIDDIKAQLYQLTGGGTDSIAKMIEDAVAPIRANVGTLDNLKTNATGNIVDAINELVSNNANVEKTSKVTVSVDTENLSQGIAAKYTIQQGGRIAGIINIPSDMFLSSGKVVQNPQGQQPGTYIELTLANATHDKIYINVGTLVDIYTAQASAAEIQLEINSSTREISARIVNGAVTTAKLATNAVTTDKIKDESVTKAKLYRDVQVSLNRADSAVQEIITGSVKGAIQVDGSTVPVAGLGTAAYRNEDEITSAAEAVETKLNAYINSNDTKVNTNTASIAAINDSTTGILKQAKDYADTKDASTKTAAVNEAKKYTDSLAVNYATAVQGGRADTAVQKADVVEGTTNGAILVQNKVVKVHGLGTAAFQDVGDFDAAGSAAAAKTAAVTEAKTYIDSALTWETIA